jgi:hypothetical protein
MINGFRSDEDIEQFLNSPTVVEKFREAKGSGSKRDQPQISPLVQQAEAFALYLNPPPPPKPKIPKPIVPGGKPEEPLLPEPPRPPDPTPKFTVVATSFYESSPETSLALIDEPGKGRHWVRQGSMVSHLIIEQIKDGFLVVKGAKRTFEVGVDLRPRRRSLLAGPPPVSLGAGGPTGSKSTPALGSAASLTTGEGVTSGVQRHMPTEEERVLAERIFAELEAMAAEMEMEAVSAGAGPNKVDLEPRPEERQAAIDKAFSGPEATRISGDEEKKLGHLGQELKDVQQDPNRAKLRKDRRDLIRRRIEERKKRARERTEKRRLGDDDEETDSD